MQVYKQKVKHLLHEHQSSITELKRDTTVAITLEQHEHHVKEDGLKVEKRSLKVCLYNFLAVYWQQRPNVLVAVIVK